MNEILLTDQDGNAPSRLPLERGATRSSIGATKFRRIILKWTARLFNGQKSVLSKNVRNKTPADQRDIFRPQTVLQRHKFEAQE